MKRSKNSDPTELVKAHWDYVKALLEAELPDDVVYNKQNYLQLVGFHYVTAMLHGYKHGREANDAT